MKRYIVSVDPEKTDAKTTAKELKKIKGVQVDDVLESINMIVISAEKVTSIKKKIEGIISIELEGQKSV